MMPRLLHPQALKHATQCPFARALTTLVPGDRLLLRFRRVSTRSFSCHLVSFRAGFSCALVNIVQESKLFSLQSFPHTLNQKRHFAKRRDFQLDGLPFSVSPDQALEDFHQWADEEQGLSYLRKKQVNIGATYAPVWSFDVNIRFVTTGTDGKKSYDWKPEIFDAAYRNQPVMYISGLACYAGHSYRRSLINPILNTTLVFMGDKTMPFEKYMLRDMKLSNGARLSVFPDPWNATRGRAFAVIREDLEALAKEAPGNVTVQTEVVSARRVYMPTYVIEYSVVGMEYKAFVSGCDAGAGVSGVSHKVLDYSNEEIQKASSSFLSNAAKYGARFMGGRHFLTRLVVLVQLFGGLLARLLPRIPPLAALGGAFVGFRKIIRPWMDNRSASAEWERQREYESISSEHPERADDFVDSGSARRYYERNRSEILRHLSGEYSHQQGEYDWYAQWEEWARRQWEQQQQQTYHQQQQRQHQTYGQQAYGQQQQKMYQRQQQRKKAKPEYQWDFDPNDPYSVLGLKRGATKSEVSAAFRREMLKHHPDTQAGASEAAKERSTERSKLITDAYRKIKAEMK